jgi:hypothetical protein
MTGEEVTSTLSPAEIKQHLTDNPPTRPDDYDTLAADHGAKVNYDASMVEHQAALDAVQAIIDSQV